MNPRDDHTYVSPYIHWDMHIEVDPMTMPRSWLTLIFNAAVAVAFCCAVCGLLWIGK